MCLPYVCFFGYIFFRIFLGLRNTFRSTDRLGKSVVENFDTQLRYGYTVQFYGTYEYALFDRYIMVVRLSFRCRSGNDLPMSARSTYGRADTNGLRRRFGVRLNSFGSPVVCYQ